MAPLFVLTVAILLARLAGRGFVASLRGWDASTRVGLAVMLLFTASAHFSSMREDLIRMVPPEVPNPEFLVTFTGICEVLGAIGLLVRGTRRAAAAALIALFVAVLPANIYAARENLMVGSATATPLWPRVGLQLLFIGLVWWSGWRKADVPGSEPGQNASRRA